nr:integrase, catalytic region, zinc finger, CCHC-type, peptidase aspartic, catalytic [Tanacetum cinerariifolium]
MSSACNNIKLDSQDVISKVVCAMCKQCLISVNHDVCLHNYVNGKNSRGKKQKAKVSFTKNQKKYQPKVTKPKKVGFLERLATPKPRKPRFLLRWSPTGRLFDQKGNIVDSSEFESQSDCFNGYPDLFVVRRLGLFQAHDRKSKASHQFCLEVYGNWQFCDSDLEVASRRNACFVRNLDGVDLLKGDRSTNLYTINLHAMASASFLSPRIRPLSPKVLEAEMNAIASSLYHSLHPSGTPPLLPIPLSTLSTSCRAGIPEADTPPRNRPLLATPRPGCETRLRDTERRMMAALELVNLRVSYQVDVCTRESSEICTRHHDAQKDRAAVRAEIEVLRSEILSYEQEGIQTRKALARSEAYCRALEARVAVLETHARRLEWQRQVADDLAVQHIMRTQALEAGARDDTLEDTGSSS